MFLFQVNGAVKKAITKMVPKVMVKNVMFKQKAGKFPEQEEVIVQNNWTICFWHVCDIIGIQGNGRDEKALTKMVPKVNVKNVMFKQKATKVSIGGTEEEASVHRANMILPNPMNVNISHLIFYARWGQPCVMERAGKIFTWRLVLPASRRQAAKQISF